METAEMLTLEQFQATREWCDSLRKVPGWEEYEIGPGYVYCEGFVIEKIDGGWQLTIENTSKILDLETAERELYDFCIASGGIE